MYLPTEIKKNILYLNGNWKYFGNTNRIVSLEKLNIPIFIYQFYI